MKLVKNNIEEMPIKSMPKLYCFGGHNISIQMDKIKNIEQLYWYGNDNNENIPILMFTLSDGTKLSADYESWDDAKEAMNYYKREFIRSI